jgi:hypothetical protein
VAAGLSVTAGLSLAEGLSVAVEASGSPWVVVVLPPRAEPHAPRARRARRLNSRGVVIVYGLPGELSSVEPSGEAERLSGFVLEVNATP